MQVLVVLIYAFSLLASLCLRCLCTFPTIDLHLLLFTFVVVVVVVVPFDNSSARRHDKKEDIPHLVNARLIIATAPIIRTHCWWTTAPERPQFICRSCIQVDDIGLLVSQPVRQEQQLETGGYHGVTSHSVWTPKRPLGLQASIAIRLSFPTERRNWSVRSKNAQQIPFVVPHGEHTHEVLQGFPENSVYVCRGPGVSRPQECALRLRVPCRN